MNSITVVLCHGVGVELRVETPSADSLAEKQTGRVFAREIMRLQIIGVHISKVDIARHLQWELPARYRLRWTRFLASVIHSRLGSLSPSKRGDSHRQAENLPLKALHDRPVPPSSPFRKRRA